MKELIIDCFAGGGGAESEYRRQPVAVEICVSGRSEYEIIKSKNHR